MKMQMVVLVPLQKKTDPDNHINLKKKKERDIVPLLKKIKNEAAIAILRIKLSPRVQEMECQSFGK